MFDIRWVCAVRQ